MTLALTCRHFPRLALKGKVSCQAASPQKGCLEIISVQEFLREFPQGDEGPQLPDPKAMAENDRLLPPPPTALL